VNVTVNRSHPTQASPKTEFAGLFSDKLGEPIHKASADEFGEECKECFQLEHGLMVALSGPKVKAGNCS
jgi:hypothetical protein